MNRCDGPASWGAHGQQRRFPLHAPAEAHVAHAVEAAQLTASHRQPAQHAQATSVGPDEPPGGRQRDHKI
jgi:hypothetical protein